MSVRTALITGGTTGIGLELTRQLVADGARVAVCARNEERLAALQAEMGDQVIVRQADVVDPRAAGDVVRWAEAALGGLDLVIANAGIGGTQGASTLTIDDITDVLGVNVLGATATITAAIPGMVERGRGHLVGITSIAGVRGLPKTAAYSASKAAFSIFLESLRVDLRGTGVSVTDIRPGFVKTPMTDKHDYPMPFLMDADKAARKILRASIAGRAVFSFPWQMAAGAWILRRIPNWIYDSFATKTALSP